MPVGYWLHLVAHRVGRWYQHVSQSERPSEHQGLFAAAIPSAHPGAG
jgi:hypothetical protein